jgi:replication-associated recombination protein RarA
MLFAESDALKPLAERMRPRSLDEIVGQTRLRRIRHYDAQSNPVTCIR